MPYASDKQRNLMRAVAHSPSFAKKVGIPQSVGQKFETHKAKGGEIMAGKKLFGGKESYAEELKEAKAIKSGRITPQEYAREERKEERSMKTKKMAAGGMPAAPGGGGPGTQAAVNAMRANALAQRQMMSQAQGAPGVRMAKGGPAKKYAKGGSIDGIASKGKTKGTVIKMKGGGSCM